MDTYCFIPTLLAGVFGVLVIAQSLHIENLRKMNYKQVRVNKEVIKRQRGG